MPTQSVLVRDSSFLRRVLQQYLSLLKKYPVITKSVTSGFLSAVGNLLSQALEYRKNSKENSPKKKISFLGPLHYAIFGLFITGPVSHYIYQLLEVLLPTTVPYCLIKRLLLERLIFAPAFLLLFYVVMNALEGKTLTDVQNKLLTCNEDELESLDPISVHQYQLCTCTVSSAVCQPGCFILVCLPSLCEEMKPQNQLQCT
ncbi:peroxisomal membrane protein 2 isoform X1 [Carassius gibelio]|uniref:peroxisomal membrane protein 2 isoform X1 n=1 Tax=Carassius gibelio TaxID=101364 RepID=UPI002277C39B|nr:peroxisomal membrane protein 2 isoform X1 [Carassius gibelio]